MSKVLSVSWMGGKQEKRETTEKEDKITEKIQELVELVSEQQEFPLGFRYMGFDVHIIKNE